MKKKRKPMVFSTLIFAATSSKGTCSSLGWGLGWFKTWSLEDDVCHWLLFGRWCLEDDILMKTKGSALNTTCTLDLEDKWTSTSKWWSSLATSSFWASMERRIAPPFCWHCQWRELKWINFSFPKRAPAPITAAAHIWSLVPHASPRWGALWKCWKHFSRKNTIPSTMTSRCLININ